MQLLGGQAPPRKYDYLTVYDPQENVFTCRLFTPKKMYLLVGLLIFLSSCRLLHVHVFLGRLAVKKTLLEGQPPRKLYFPCNPNLVVHAWRCTAKKHFLGGFPIFLGGFWPPRKFRSVVVYVEDHRRRSEEEEEELLQLLCGCAFRYAWSLYIHVMCASIRRLQSFT